MNQTIDVLGVGVLALERESAMQLVLRRLESRGEFLYAFLNAHGANLAYSSDAFRNALSDMTVFPDGVGVDLAAKISVGHTFPDNLNGTDFIPELLSRLPAGCRVGLLGAEKSVVFRARESMASLNAHLEFFVVSDGFFDSSSEHTFLDALASDPVDVLLVALGNPKQELWISRNAGRGLWKAAFGVGALFDFAAKRVSRAPEFVRVVRLEWLYRLALEPGRLFSRYVIGNPLFIFRVILRKLFG